MPPGAAVHRCATNCDGRTVKVITPPAITGAEACESQNLDATQCAAVGCCEYDGFCWSSVGTERCSCMLDYSCYWYGGGDPSPPSPDYSDESGGVCAIADLTAGGEDSSDRIEFPVTLTEHDDCTENISG